MVSNLLQCKKDKLLPAQPRVKLLKYIISLAVMNQGIYVQMEQLQEQ